MQTGIMTLAEFLLARIAEDEHAAPREHVGRWQTGRVLAECDAKRRIVEAAIFATRDLQDTFGTPLAEIMVRAALLAESVLDALALPYADHPDYREEWKP